MSLSANGDATVAPNYHVVIRDSRGVVIGDNNVVYQYFLNERYRPLAEHLIAFDDLITERTANFVGREFLDARLDAFLETHDRGYFVLEGEPGIGKTAWAAHLVRERQALHHFNVAALGVTRPDQALGNLCTQLIACYDLGIAYLPPDAGRDGCYLDRLLHQAGERLGVDRLLIVVDALDEVQMEARGANLLYLPPSLPASVYFVLTWRPQPLSMEAAPGTPLELLTLRAEMAENRADLRAYLHRQADRTEIAGHLVEWGIFRDRFIAALLERCAGNFMYLAYLLPDIAAGLYDPLALDQLPHGLRGYYERFWQEMEAAKGEGRETWTRFYKPVIGLLTAAREPVSAAWLGRILGIDPDEVADFALARWRKFLQDTTVGVEKHWRLYHASFGDFLAEKLDGARRYHSQIADYYWAACGGDWSRLIDVDSGYGLRYYAVHLAEGERWDELYALVATGDDDFQPWAEARHGSEGSCAGYLADLNLAWQRADKIGERDPQAIGRQVRYAVIQASLHTLAQNIPTALLVALVEHKMPGWTAAAALDHARQIPNYDLRAEALVALARYLPAELLTEALSAAQAIEDEHARTDALLSLIPYLPAVLLPECLTAARRMKWQDCCAKVLVALAPYLPAELLAEGLATGRAIDWKGGRAQALGALAPRLPTELQQPVLVEALAAACDIEEGNIRAETLGALVPHLPAELQSQALDIACATKWEHGRAKALRALAPHLPDELLTRTLAAATEIGLESLRAEALAGLVSHLPAKLLSEALAAARTIKNEYIRAELLSHLVPHLSAELQREVLAGTLAIARTIESEYVRAEILSRLGHHLSAGLRRRVLTEALVAALAIKEPHSRVPVLASLVPDLPTDLRQQALAGALTAVRSVPETNFLFPDMPSPRAEALGHVACHLPADILADALDIARAIKWKDGRADALARLAPYLPAEQRRGVLAEALVVVRSIRDAEDDHAEALIALTAYHLPSDLQAQILAVVRAIEWRGSRARAMVALAPHLPIGPRWQVQSEAVDNASRIHDREMRIDALVALAPDLPASLKEKALTRALDSVPGISDLEERVVALGKLAPRLPPGLQPRALAIACAIDDNSARVRALLSLISCLPPGLRGQAASAALDTIRRLPETGRYTSGNPRAEALSYLAPHLPTESLIEALADARSIVNDMARARVLAALTPFLPASLQAQAVTEALDTLRPTGSEGILAQVLCTLTPYVPADRQQKILIEALTAAFAIKDPSSRVEVLTGLASHLSGKLKQQAVTEALAAVRAIRWEETRVEALVGLAPHLTAELLTKALSIARATRHAGARAEALGRVIPYLQTDHRQQVLAEALAVVTRAERWSEGRSRALAILTNIWAAWAKEARPAAYSLWPEILHALANCSRQNLLADLRALVPVIFALGGTEAAEETAQAILDVKRWWP